MTSSAPDTTANFPRYSICIRTLGTSGERFDRLLKSIESQTIQPSEIVVVLPHGYSAPPELRGNERVVFTEKGMLSQRVRSIECAGNDHVLLVDDDVEFECGAASKLMLVMKEYGADIVYPINRDLLPDSNRGWLRSMTLQAVPRKNQREFIRMLPTGGYSYRDKDPAGPVPSESCPGMVLLAKRDALLAINLREDLWVDTSPYAFRDDAILSYKAHLSGCSIYAVPGIATKHLCGTTRLDPKRATYSAFSVGCNNIMFWKLFILMKCRTMRGKLAATIMFSWSVVALAALFTLNSILKRSPSIVSAFIQGTSAGLVKER